MINRELIRLKIVQVVYAYYVNGGKAIETTEKELFHSLSQSYELYQQLLLLIISIHNVANSSVEAQKARAKMMSGGAEVSTKFADNRFAAQLKANEQLLKYRENLQNPWLEEEDYLRRLYHNITLRDFYVDYMASKESSYEEDRELWRKIYRNVLCNNDELDEILEGLNLYWNDDKAIIDTFVLKTIKRFKEENGGAQELLPEFDSEEDKTFASTILRNALENANYYHKLISEQTKNWELSRIARMDLVIMQVALAEIMSVPDIPVGVSINEYVDITKAYSTPRSGAYVNGMLDATVKRLAREGKITDKTTEHNKQ